MIYVDFRSYIGILTCVASAEHTPYIGRAMTKV